MKVSIITVVYNNISTLRDTIESVLGQDYHDIEYIIIDGKSTDGTVDLVQSYGSLINHFVSEKDDGLYDAINKGIQRATGEIIGLLHSDDLFYSTNAISQVVAAFQTSNADSVYGDLHYVEKENTLKIVRDWRSGSYQRGRFRRGWMPPHPTFYVKKSVYDTYGLYDTEFKSAADYELMLRFLYKYSISTHYIKHTLVRMRMGGESNRSIFNRLQANKEDYFAWKKNELSPSFYTRYLKPLRKLPQFLPIRDFFLSRI